MDYQQINHSRPELKDPAINSESNSLVKSESETILCRHCNRTATNGISCKGICVADNEY